MTSTVLLLALVTIPAILFIVYLVVRVRYKKAGPDEALIVFGRRKLLGKKVRSEKGEVEGFRIIRGGGTFVWPAWEQYEVLSLRMMTLEIDLPHVYTVQGIPINVKAVAQVKVQGDIEHIRSAAEGFLGMPVDEVQATIKETVAGYGRASKEQVQHMVTRTLGLKEVPPPDAADAIAAAMTHFFLYREG